MDNYLCICNGGNVRSAALAQIFKEADHEAIAIGMDHTSKESLEYFVNWADVVIDLSDDPDVHLELYAGDKYQRHYFGPDIWHDPRHPDLKTLAGVLAEDYV